MTEKKEITIRTAKISDLKNLRRFFIKAYGEQTVFQNEQFLLYYFFRRRKNSVPLSTSIVGLSPKGDIISHYGGLHYNLVINKTIIPLIWGVNAYTLPEWREKGINSKIAKHLHSNEANAVIGMPSKAPLFYKKLGYNIFNKATLNRFVYIFDPKTFHIIHQIGQNKKRAKELLVIKKSNTLDFRSENIVELTKYNFHNFNFDLNINSIATTYRDLDFLSWRLFKNPYIEYKVYGYLKNNTIITYIATRKEALEPNNSRVNRIIDLFGKTEGIINLLNFVIKESFSYGTIYLDFSMFGKLYEEELISSGFIKLENDDVSLLPQVTTPIENRPNHEFIVIHSKVHNELIQTFTKENVYFTRIDGDRDRIALKSQIKQ